ncbi:uncharacterized protein N7446_012695, partial [Penicillium canescens]
LLLYFNRDFSIAAILLRNASDTTSYSQQSRVSSIIVCNAVLIATSSLGLFVRFFVRIRYLAGIDLDDVFCAISWVCQITVDAAAYFSWLMNISNKVFAFVECPVCILMTQYGYGTHIDTIHDIKELQMFLKLDFVTEISYLLSLGAIKISFSWDAVGTGEVKCLSLFGFYYISFGIRLATNIALFTLPIPYLLRLQMTIGKRAGLIFMFALGILLVATSIIRATYLNNFSADHTWELVSPLNWSSVELGVALFVACLPSFKALVTLRFPSLRRFLGLSSNRSYPVRYELYGTSGQRTDVPQSWGRARRFHIGQTKLGSTTTHTQTEVEASGDGSEERIISSQSPVGIQVTTD